MNDPGNLDAVRPDAIDEGVGVTGHHAFARPPADTRPEHQTRLGDLLGLGQDGVDDAIGDDIPGNLEVELLNGFKIARWRD